MSKRNENDDDNSRTNNSDDDSNHNEYPPNVVRFEPDIGLGNQQRKRRSSGGHPRREESSISFRHFLQNEAGHSSNTPYPDLYSCSRQERPLIDGSIDPESPDLPDFVQDHLAVEHMYFNDGSTVQSVNLQNLPDFASCMLRHENNEIRHRQQLANNPPSNDNRLEPRNRVPLDLPATNFFQDNRPPMNASSSLPFDLTTHASVVSNACDARSSGDIEPVNSGGGRLPDFLSDGHALAPSNTRHRDAREVQSENSVGLEAHTERQNLISMLRHENDRLLDELTVLQSVLTKKDDRITELEDLVTALEISKLQMSTDANTQTTSKSVGEDEAKRLKKAIQLSKNEVDASPRESEAEIEAASLKHVLRRSTAHLANSSFIGKMRGMTSSSEQLVRELLKVIMQMQQEMDRNDAAGSSPQHKSDDGRDDGASGSTSTV